MEHGATLWQLVEQRAAATPDAIVFVDDRDRSLTFRELRDQAEIAAAGFHARGVREGTIVSWELPNFLETCVLACALARLGAVQNPIAPLFREREVGFIVDQLGTNLLIVPSVWRGFDYEAMARTVQADNPGLDLYVLGELPSGDPATLPPAPDDASTDARPPVRWVLYTSGTTSDPKGARHSDSGFIFTGTHMAARMHMGPEDRNALVFPFAHIGGILYLFMDLIVGSSSILVERFGPEGVEVLSRHGVTIAGAGVPFFRQYLRSQEQAGARRIFPKVKAFVGGGGTRPPVIHDELRAAFGVPLLTGYGLTEACSFTMSDLDDPEDIRRVSEGRPYPGAEIRICDPDGKPLPPGADGEICLRGPQLMQGYVDPALNVAFDAEGFFHTGDLGHLDDEGFLHVTGRIKDIVIRNGENISAREVEDLLTSHPDIEEAAVIGLPDPVTGERACAVVALRSPNASITLESVRDFLVDAGLAKYKVPEQLEVVDVLPKNVGGKVLKHVLQEEYAAKPFTRV